MFPVFVRQDGADFYLYAFFDLSADSYICTISSDNRVRDFDIEAAEKARAWFIGAIARLNLTATFIA